MSEKINEGNVGHQLLKKMGETHSLQHSGGSAVELPWDCSLVPSLSAPCKNWSRETVNEASGTT